MGSHHCDVTSLPLDVWANIFQQLEKDQKSLYTIRLCVSRFFRNNIPDIYYPPLLVPCKKRKVLNYYNDLLEFTLKFKQGSLLRRWICFDELRFTSDFEWKQVCKLVNATNPILSLDSYSFPLTSEKHTSLDLKPWKSILTQGLDNKFTLQGPSPFLQSLIIGETIPLLSQETFVAPQLKKLDINVRKNDEMMLQRYELLLKHVSSSLEQLFVRLPSLEQYSMFVPHNLQKLTIKGPRYVHLSGLSSKLRELSVPSSAMWAAEAIVANLEKLETMNVDLVLSVQLKHLFLDMLHETHDANTFGSVLRIAELPHLENLQLQHINNLMIVLDHIPAIQKLSIHRSMHVHVRFDQPLVRLEKLLVCDSYVVVDDEMFPHGQFPLCVDVYGANSTLCLSYLVTPYPVHHVRAEYHGWPGQYSFLQQQVLEEIVVFSSPYAGFSFENLCVQFPARHLSLFFLDDIEQHVVIQQTDILESLTVQGPIMVTVHPETCPRLSTIKALNGAHVLSF